VAPRPAADRARVVVVDRPSAVQTEILVGCPGPDRSTGHGWAPYPVLSFVLGGSPTARVDAVLREEKGYTYGIRTSFRPRAAGGSFVAQGSVRSEVTAEAVELLLGILAGARDGFTATELRSGVDFVGKTAPGRYATADAIADETGSLVLEGLPLDFTTTNLREVAALTLDDLDEAYRRTVTGEWTVVLVGDAEQVVPTLEATLPGPVGTVAR
jgi:zinc protease